MALLLYVLAEPLVLQLGGEEPLEGGKGATRDHQKGRSSQYGSSSGKVPGSACGLALLCTMAKQLSSASQATMHSLPTRGGGLVRGQVSGRVGASKQA